ncbi:hypothetical protein Avbf_08533 [Armadillidium vulgare]|nr:hypothetical protein Avbf_08533 [Armadillidium vulgare]
MDSILLLEVLEIGWKCKKEHEQAKLVSVPRLIFNLPSETMKNGTNSFQLLFLIINLLNIGG